ncbi:MAG: Ribosome biogenesis protein brx1 [Bathelium mastoideum]|nr:MAG: Ribosome biogenesis protein brx1 [Bathelium mastoideum]
MAAVYKALSRLEPDEKNVDGVNGEKKEKGEKSEKKNRQKVLILSSRGVTHRHRHLINDLYALLPHSRKDPKLDTKTKLYQLNELADLYSCNNVLFFEARKGQDLYLWLAKAPNGPTAKLHLQNLHTMAELHFTGNCLRGSRPILSFDRSFDDVGQPHWRVLRELLTQTFGVPKSSRKMKPFVDHVMAFSLAQGRMWVRNYQIAEAEEKAKANGAHNDDEDEDLDDDGGVAVGTKAKQSRKKPAKDDTRVSLVEIGPRFVLTPIVMLESSFGGPVIYENKEFVSPNQVRAELRRARSGKFNRRVEGQVERKVKKGDLGLVTEGGRKQERDALDVRELFA